MRNTPPAGQTSTTSSMHNASDQTDSTGTTSAENDLIDNNSGRRVSGEFAPDARPSQHADSVLAVEIDHVTKHYGQVVALRDVSLQIKDREFFTLLGPSGCGKTTLLRAIAGFETVTTGAIYLRGAEIEKLPPNLRPVNTVFQQYSLFPHMTVDENVRFGLQMKKADPAFVAKRTREMLEMVQLSEFANRKPAQLSGGQQQRVALARALAPQPEVLLLDEPLSALDLKLRQAMRIELKRIQQETGITFVFVTHDQEEALTMSDRIAVMSNGEVQQVGSAAEIYREPNNQFVADFIGETNMLDSTVVLDSTSASVRCTLPAGGDIECRSSQPVGKGTTGKVCIRPEALSLLKHDDPQVHLGGRIEQLIYLGTDTQIVMRLDAGGTLLVRKQNSDATDVIPTEGSAVGVKIDTHAARFLVN